MASNSISITWIRSHARPYLRGLRPVRQASGDLRGYWFMRSAGRATARKREEAGFFVGHVVESKEFHFLDPLVPECVVFACVRPVGGRLHRRLVRAPESLVRRTFDYIRWLTHRPPRFRFFDSQIPAMIRHTSMRDWPREKYEHFSRNFFTETLAWLVRSGLVRKLAAEVPEGARRRSAAKRPSRKPSRRRR